jgi:putative transposase
MEAISLAIGDGVMGFWNAGGKVSLTTGQQRCWAHKTANVKEKLIVQNVLTTYKRACK